MPARRLLAVALTVVASAGCASARSPVVPVAAPTTSAPTAARHVATAPVRRPTDPPTLPGCPAPGRGTLVVAGRDVLRGVPAGVRRPPLVLALAGYDQSRQDLDRVSHLVDRARAHGVEAVLLQGTGSPLGWRYQPGEQQDVTFARRVLTALAPCTDQRRLVLLGFSDGGLMAMRIGCALGPAVHDLVLLSASVLPEQGCRLPWSVQAVHGTDDPFDPYDGNDRGIPPALTALAGWAAAAGCGHEQVTTVAPDVQERSYAGCRVSLTTLVHGGHTWPDGEPSANPRAGRVFRGYDLTAVLLRLVTT